MTLAIKHSSRDFAVVLPFTDGAAVKEVRGRNKQED